jgi:hypothetical protein
MQFFDRLAESVVPAAIRIRVPIVGSSADDIRISIVTQSQL